MLTFSKKKHSVHPLKERAEPTPEKQPEPALQKQPQSTLTASQPADAGTEGALRDCLHRYFSLLICFHHLESPTDAFRTHDF